MFNDIDEYFLTMVVRAHLAFSLGHKQWLRVIQILLKVF